MHLIAMSRYMFYFLLSLFVFKYVSCDELPSSLVTTMNKLNQALRNHTKWDSSTNPCSWSGVSCTRNNSFITKLSLSSLSISNENVDNSWPSLVCDIQTLESLDISNNRLNLIPQPFLLASCGAGGLKALNVSNNDLTGSLPTFQGPLEVLDLSHNSFENVVVDSQFAGLNELRSLNISNNYFRGSVPTKLGNSTHLQELQLSMNSFDGPIPDQFTKYSNLTLLDLSVNQLSGTIPSGIGELSKLQFLLLSLNNLTGEIPQSISAITTLERFAANQNGFTGGIPLGITSHLKTLDLSYNELNGSIPSDLLSQPNLLTVDLCFNLLQGSIPSNISATLVRLRLGSNRLTGGIPSWSFGDDVLPSLTFLEVDNNSLSGTIPPELGLFENLWLLDLSHNNLGGFVPRELGELDRLQVLQLQQNKLYGEIPNEISYLQILVRLNMSGNSMNGSIPSSLSMLQKLTNLDLHANKLSGEVPSSFGSMDSLLELQLGNNQLGGTIRSLPTKLQIALNLSHNNFGGPIPEVIAILQSLEVLDLSNNRFSGDFPVFLRQLGSLTVLDVSNNMLTGSVPQFGKIVIVLTGGNPNLSNTSDPSSIPARKNSKPSVAIIVASTAAVVALVIVGCVALIVSRRIHKDIKSNLLTLNVIHRTNLDFSKAMEAMRHTSNVIVKTRFSTYYKAIMPSGMSYIVKKLDWSDKMFPLGTRDLFETELEILGRLRNSNVMIPLAYTLTRKRAYLFYEFTDKGSLFDVLHGSMGSGLDWTHRYSIALGVANGLAFLHGHPLGSITLLDLSSKVVMLKSFNEPQIGDIELSKVIDPSKSTEYAYTMRVTMAGNVYSFGVILLELLTGKAAISEGSELAKWVLSKSKQNDDLDQILDSAVSRTSPATRDQMLEVLWLALACVSESPEARPEMRSVLSMLLNVRN